jgi:hypothetical protein
MSAAEIPDVCRKLRTKAAFNADPEGAQWKKGDATTEAYWCLLSMEAFGPDDSFCHPDACGPRRSCYRPADDVSVALVTAEHGRPKG